MLRSLASFVGRLLVGSAVFLVAIALVILGLGAYLLAVPYAKMGRGQSRLLAVVQAAQAGAALLAVLRQAHPELDLLAPDDEAEN